MEAITKLALVGTAQHAGLSVAEHPSDAVLAGVTGDDREHAFLLRSAAQALYHHAGRKPAAGIEAPPPAPADSLRPGSRKLAGLLQNALATNAFDLLVEFLRLMETGKILLPPDVLPQALDCGDANVRERLLPVLGERGRWLARHNPDWSWVESGVSLLNASDRAELKRAWDEGTIRERLHALITLRRSDANEGRTWLEAVFPQEKAEHRARLLEALTHGLSAQDESFLEVCLADRSSNVAQLAADLLSRLSGSALAARMRDRADAMLQSQKKGLIRRKLVLTCTPPEAIEKDWERDGVPKNAPSGRGKRALWAETVIAAVPPSHWAKRFATAPAALIEAAIEDQFGDATIEGWTAAAVRFADDPETAAWFGPLWDHWSGKAERLEGAGHREALERLQTLLPRMPAAAAEQAMLHLLDTARGSGKVELLYLLNELPRPWSARFAGRYLALIREVFQKQTDNRAYQWANTLSVAARALPVESFPAALAPWEFAPPPKSASAQFNPFERETEKFLELIRTRQSFVEEVRSNLYPEVSSEGVKDAH